jgi:hypothetical protein
MDEKLLNGWKEIGSYLGRTARTAQRWESQLDLPIHRPATRKRTAVIALRREVDAWLVRNCTRIDSAESRNAALDIAVLSEKLARLQMEAAQLALELRRVKEESPHLLDGHSSSTGEYPPSPV